MAVSMVGPFSGCPCLGSGLGPLIFGNSHMRKRGREGKAGRKVGS